MKMKVNIVNLLILVLVKQMCCDNEFIVKVNKKYSTPIIGNDIKPQQFEDIKQVTELEFISVEDRKVPSSLSISDFSSLNMLIIENQLLEDTPQFTNLRIGQLSLGHNKIKTIKNTTFSTDVYVNDYIYLHDNQISSIDDNTFPKTDGIILNCNNLTTFKASWFRDQSFLRTIYLRNNKIATLDANTFENLPRMFHLMMASNQIKELPDNIFHFKNLHTLDLENNQLYEVHSSWFTQTNLTITRLRLSFNRLSYIKEDFLNKVKIYYAFFSGNPWQCPCLNLIKKWMRDTQIYSWVLDEYKDVLPICIYANSFKEHCIPHIDPELYETYISGTDVPFKKQNCKDLF